MKLTALLLFLLAFDWVDDPVFGYCYISNSHPAIHTFCAEKRTYDHFHDTQFIAPAMSFDPECSASFIEPVPAAFFEPPHSLYVFMSIRR